MRDIQADLHERIQAVDRDIGRLKAALKQQEEKKTVLSAMLKQEQESKIDKSLPAVAGNGHYTSPAAQFIFAAFQKQNPCELRQLRDAAIRQGIDFEGKTPGRVLHFLLVGMEKNGLVDHLEDGRWSLKGGK